MKNKSQVDNLSRISDESKKEKENTSLDLECSSGESSEPPDHEEPKSPEGLALALILLSMVLALVLVALVGSLSVTLNYIFFIQKKTCPLLPNLLLRSCH
jgi:hypothetical protein